MEPAHQVCIHQFTEPTRAFIQQRYHVIGLRKALASIRFHCFLCRRFDKKNIQPIIAPLPSYRLPTTATHYPFANSGVDFFGPFYVKGVVEKHYGLIFTCMVTRAVHLETCPDLNTDTFLNAFGRYCSRRCQPQLLYSDNGKTFVGASEELKKTVKAWNNDRIYKALAVANTTWKFNPPPYGPHFGGVWERLIHIAKRTLLLILGSRRLSFDTFLTMMLETESIINSRPLANVAEQPDEEPLTPNHFLIQSTFNSLPPGQFGDQQPASLKT